MGGFAGGNLAASVTQAGGLGLIGSIMAPDLEKELSIAADALRSSQDSEILPIGVAYCPS